MEYRTIALVIAAGAAACGGSQRAAMDTARIERNADTMHRDLQREDRRGTTQPPVPPPLPHAAEAPRGASGSAGQAEPLAPDDTRLRLYVATLRISPNLLDPPLAPVVENLVSVALEKRTLCGSSLRGRPDRSTTPTDADVCLGPRWYLYRTCIAPLHPQPPPP